MVRKGCFHYEDEFVGFLEGWRGVLEDKTMPLDLASVGGILPRGGTILRTSRTNPGKKPGGLEQCIATAEPAYLAKHAFQLAQPFNNFYHRFHILTESDSARKQLLLATAAVAERELIRVLSWLGIDAPEVM